jgi:O-antigen ligase
MVSGIAALAALLGVAIAHGGRTATLGALVIVAIILIPALGEFGFRGLVWALPLEAALYPFARFPSGAHPYVTFDRIWFLTLLGSLVVFRRLFPRAKASRVMFRALVAIACVDLVRDLATPGFKIGDVGQWIDAFLLPLVAFVVVSRLATTTSRLRQVAFWMMVTGVVLGVYGIAQRVIGFDLASRSGGALRLDSTVGVGIRVSGPYPVPEVLALALLMCFAATLYFIQVQGRRWISFAVFAIGLELAGIFLTYFRAAWLGALIIIIASFGLRPGRYARAAMAVATTGLVVVVVLSQVGQSSAISSRLNNTENIYTRLATWKQGIEIFRSHPLAGVGVGRYQVAAAETPSTAVDAVENQLGAHSSYILILAEEGIIGFAALVAVTLCAWLLIRAYRRSARTRDDVILGATVAGAGIGYLVMSLTLAMLPYGPTNTLFAILLGMAAARLDAATSARRPTGQTVSPSRPLEGPLALAGAGGVRR